MLNKDGSFQRTIRYRGPDLDSATEAELVSITARLNNVLKRFGEGWALFFEAERIPANAYPGHNSPTPHPGWSIRSAMPPSAPMVPTMRAATILTLLYLPPPDTEGRAERWLYDRGGADTADADAWAQLDWFRTETDRALDMLSAMLPEAEALGDAETLGLPARHHLGQASRRGDAGGPEASRCHPVRYGRSSAASSPSSASGICGC